MPPVAESRQVERHVQIYSRSSYIATYLESYGPYLTNSFQRGLDRLVRHKASGSKLLDVGCGFGFFLSMARDAGFAVEGIEVGPSLAREGKRMYGLEIRPGDILELDLGQMAYDLVTAWDVLEHCANPGDVLMRFSELVAADGLLLIRVPDLGFLQQGLPKHFCQSYLDLVFPLDVHEHAYHYTEDSLRLLPNRYGFEIIDRWPSDDDEYTPRDIPEYADLLNEMRRHRVACEMNFLCRLSAGQGVDR